MKKPRTYHDFVRSRIEYFRWLANFEDFSHAEREGFKATAAAAETLLKAEEAAHVEPNRKTWARLWKNQADLRAILEGWDPPREEKQCLNCGQFYEGNDGCPFCGSSDFERDDWLPAGWQYYGSIFGLWKHFSGREL